MDIYFAVKTIHIISATILFGTSIGIANFFFFSHFTQDVAARRFAARMTVRADYSFTLPAVILQPLSGAWLIWKGGFDWTDYWLACTYAPYALAGLCWVPVVIIQIRMKQMLERQAAGHAIDQPAYDRLFRWWFALGWPAFGGLIIGGYGSFGSYIARSLANDEQIQLLIGGRSKASAEAFIRTVDKVHPTEAHAINIFGDMAVALARISPDIVIHTTGPFQSEGHEVARAA